jgi:4-amino-4-deoxy-L-arabinose transferase-like glycosyltransferase
LVAILVTPSLLPSSTKALQTGQVTRLSAFFPIGAIVVAALIMCFGMLGSVPLFNPDEGLYAEPAREMLETGEWVTTLLNYVVRYTKPPLVIWAMAASFHVLGVNEFAARFFVACCAFVMVIATYLFTEKYLGKRTASLSALMLLTSPLYIAVGREAITDMPLVLYMAAAIMAFYFAFREKNAAAKWTGYVLVALAAMTKGPVGLLLPFTIMPVYFYLRGQLKEALSFFSIGKGLLIVCLIALPWYAVEIYITKGAYFNEFIMRENFARFTSVVDAHKGPFWYHLAAIMAGFFPWSLLLPQLIWQGWNGIFARHHQESGLVVLKNAREKLKSLDYRSELLLLCALTAIVIVAFFSVSVSKLLPYTLPAFPFLAIAVSDYIVRIADENQARKLLVPGLVAATIYGGASLIAPIVVKHVKEAPVELIDIAKAYGLCVLIALSSAVAFSLRNRLFRGAIIFTGSLFVLTCIFGTLLLPKASRVFEEDVPAYGRVTATSTDPILLYDIRKPGFPFYSRRKVVLPPDFEALVADLNGCKRAYVVTRARDIDRLLKIKGIKVIEHGDRFAFLRWDP